MTTDADSDAQNAWWLYRGLSDEDARSDARAAAAEAQGDGSDRPGPPTAVRQHLHKDAMPPWRRFDARSRERQLGADFLVDDDVKDRVNAALLLRRPLLVTGLPGTGKTSLAHAVARELGLLPVLRWFITSRTELRDGLYQYDAIARLQDTQRHFQDPDRRGPPPSIQKYLKLGPLGTAFAGFTDDAMKPYPRVLIIDEIDKSDIDLPNDLLHIFEEGYFEIDELKRDQADSHAVRTADGGTVTVVDGRVQCESFPFVVMTSNSEREFPGPFLRRCIQLEMPMPNEARLVEIVRRKLRAESPEAYDQYRQVIEEQIIPAFAGLLSSNERDLAVDQLLQVVSLRMKHVDPFRGIEPAETDKHGPLMKALWHTLREGQD